MSDKPISITGETTAKKGPGMTVRQQSIVDRFGLDLTKKEDFSTFTQWEDLANKDMGATYPPDQPMFKKDESLVTELAKQGKVTVVAIKK